MMSVAPDASIFAARVLAACRSQGLTVGTVESCTGGLVAGALTDIPGSSDVVMAGLVTYSNAAKSALASVPSEMIHRFGAVSAEVAAAMAEGGRGRLGVDLCVAITGVAGPGGGTAQKPVGLVHFAVANRQTTHGRVMMFGNQSRSTIRALSVMTALEMLLEAAISTPSE
jgi:nicotinamide-nucleotide amidase